MQRHLAAIGIATIVLSNVMSPVSLADWTNARCDVYPAGQDRATKSIQCTFAQRQGHVTITLEDGVTYELSPVGDEPGNYRDQDGLRAYRNSGLGDQGQIFRLRNESVFVYWDTSGLNPETADDNYAAPFTTDDYDATMQLRCRSSNATEFGSCPAGVLRMEDGQASVVILSPSNEQFTVNFMADYINATKHEVDAVLDGDTWIVSLSNGEIYEVPLAAIEGG